MVESAPDSNSRADGCTHHWRIGTPSGETSTGVCKLCGASRQFQNYAYRPSMTRPRRPAANASSSK